MSGNRIVFYEIQRTAANQLAAAADGAPAALGVFTSPSATFQTSGVVAGQKLTIAAGVDAGTYVIASVDSETQLTIVGLFPVGGGGPDAYTVDSSLDFIGVKPAVTPLIQYGYAHYNNCNQAGLFDFQKNASQYGTNPVTDWLTLMSFRLYLDLANLSALSFNIINPEGDKSPIYLKGWDTYYNVGPATGSGDQDTVNIGTTQFMLRPGCSLELVTTGATTVQCAEVWWERARVVKPNYHGDDYFEYEGV